MPNFLRFNLHPIEVEIKNGDELKAIHYESRVVVTDEDVFLYVNGNSGPEIGFTDRLEDFSGNAADGWTVQTSTGLTLNMTRSVGCGCGSSLKGYNPFPGIPFEKMLS